MAQTILIKMFLSYLIIQSLIATTIFTLFSLLLLGNYYPFGSFRLFIIFQFYFSITLSFISSPSSHPIVYDKSLLTFLLSAIALVTSSAYSGSAAAESLFGLSDFRRVRLRGGLVGLLFALHYVFKHRWVLEFPIIQRSCFFNFKKGIPLAAKRAFRLSIVAIILEVVLLEIIPCPFLKCSIGTPPFFMEQIVVFVSSFALLFLWELTHNIHRNNVDTWRRAAFFEESGETYIRVIAVCLRPLEQLASRLGEDLGNSADKPTNLSNQLSSPTDVKHVEELYDFQPYAWCSRIVASLTACSRKEDKFGVAKLSGSNAAVISTLISCLLAVENFMGNQLLGLTGIKWTTANSRRLCIETAKSRRLDIATATGKRKNGPANSKAYAIADVLKTSIYQIVSAFHDEMLAGTKASLLEKDWITSEKSLFGTREMLIEKLRLFLDCWAT